MRGLIVLALALACSSGDRDKAPAAEPAPPASQAVPDKAPDAGEQACRSHGDGDICLSAAQNAYDHKRPEIAYELYELACIHGSAIGCSKRAEQTRTPALWYGMACRRGDAEACKTADAWAQSVGERLRTGQHSPGLAGDKLATVYRHAVADCLAQAPAGERDSAATLTVVVTLADPATPAVEVTGAASTTSSCLRSAASRWRFPEGAGPGPHQARFELAAGGSGR